MNDGTAEQDRGKDATGQTGCTFSGFKRPPASLGEPVSIAANLVAAFVSFTFLIVVSTILVDFVPLPDDFAAVFVQIVPMALSERATAALGVALLFLVIGIGFQLWRYRRGVANWWPLVLAFPMLAVLVVPEAAARGESIWVWAELGMAMALAFCMHWLAVLAAVELMD